MQFPESVFKAGQSITESMARDNFYCSCLEYLFTGETESLTAATEVYFELAKPELDRTRRRSEAGRKGGRGNRKKS